MTDEAAIAVEAAIAAANDDARNRWSSSDLKFLQREMNQAYKNDAEVWRAKNQECMVFGCKKNAIGSHVIQQAVLTRTVGEPEPNKDGYWVSAPKWNQASGSFVGSRVPLTNTMTFAGFCEEHDGRLFSDMEASSIRMNYLPGEFVEKQLARSYFREKRRLCHEVNNALALRAAYASIEKKLLQKLLHSRLSPALEKDVTTFIASNPDIELDFLARWSGDFTAFDDALKAKNRLLVSMKEMEAGMYQALDGIPLSDKSDVTVCSWLINVQTPFAISGCSEIFVDPDSSTANPLMVVVVPGVSGSRIIVAFSASRLQQSADFMRGRGLLDKAGAEVLAHDLLDLCEQFMIVSSDNWCVRTSDWEQVLVPVRRLVEEEIGSSTLSLESYCTEQIFPGLRKGAKVIAG